MTAAMHSASSATSRSPTPDLRSGPWRRRGPPSRSPRRSPPWSGGGPRAPSRPWPTTIGTKSARPGMYAVPAAQGPIIAATIGTTPGITSSRNRWPEPANSEPAGLLDSGAGRVEQPDQRDPLLQRQLPQPGHLQLAGHPHRAGHHGEVVGGDRSGPAVDVPPAGDHAVGRRVAALHRALREVGAGVDSRARRSCRRRRAARSARARSACRPRAGGRSSPRPRRAWPARGGRAGPPSARAAAGRLVAHRPSTAGRVSRRTRSRPRSRPRSSERP